MNEHPVPHLAKRQFECWWLVVIFLGLIMVLDKTSAVEKRASEAVSGCGSLNQAACAGYCAWRGDQCVGDVNINLVLIVFSMLISVFGAGPYADMLCYSKDPPKSGRKVTVMIVIRLGIYTLGLMILYVMDVSGGDGLSWEFCSVFLILFGMETLWYRWCSVIFGTAYNSWQVDVAAKSPA